MAGILIVSGRQHHDALKSLFAADGQPVQCCCSAGEARRSLCNGSFDLLVINAPLSDELGRTLALETVGDGLDVVLLCPAPQADQIAAGVERHGVLALPKPLSRQQVAFALRLLRINRQRMQVLLEKNRRLSKRLDEARVISQAKCVLALYRGFTEEQAHHFIETTAMNARISSREAAQDILQSYGEG